MTLPEGFDRNKCPSCGGKTAMARPKAHDLNMICEHCKYNYTDEEAEEVLGVKKVETIDSNGDKISAFINTGNGHEFYHSWYCLKRFKEWKHMDDHDKKYHKIGDRMAGSVPQGFNADWEITCGNEDVIPC